MISSNKTKPKTTDTEDVKLVVLTTNKVKPREFSFVPRDFPTVKKGETKKFPGLMLTTSNFEQIKRNEKRKALAEKIKSLRARAIAQVLAPLPEAKPVVMIEKDIAKINDQIIGTSAVPAEEIDKPKKKSRRKKKSEKAE